MLSLSEKLVVFFQDVYYRQSFPLNNLLSVNHTLEHYSITQNIHWIFFTCIKTLPSFIVYLTIFHCYRWKVKINRAQRLSFCCYFTLPKIALSLCGSNRQFWQRLLFIAQYFDITSDLLPWAVVTKLYACVDRRRMHRASQARRLISQGNKS